jgi:hypothetical protein
MSYYVSIPDGPVVVVDRPWEAHRDLPPHLMWSTCMVSDGLYNPWAHRFELDVCTPLMPPGQTPAPAFVAQYGELGLRGNSPGFRMPARPDLVKRPKPERTF